MADIDGYLEIIRSSPSGESVRDAIIQCMNDINQDAAVELSKLVITGKLSKVNHPWKPGTGKAYSMVSLQITPDDGDEPTSTNSLTYSEFNVNNDTTPGAHPAPEGTVYNVVNVNVDFKQFEDNIADNVTIDVDDLEADHTYDIVVKTGYNATKKVTILGDAIDKKIKEKGGTIGPDGATYYPCKFYEDTGKQHLIQTASVREGDDAASYFTGASPTSPHAGEVFNGWTPPTTNVRQASEFAPKFGAKSGGSPGEIGDTWEQIFEEGSAKYGIGSWKYLDIKKGKIGPRTFTSAVEMPGSGVNPTFNLGEYLNDDISIPMMQVAQGEQGSVSTWLSMEPLHIVTRNSQGGIVSPGLDVGYDSANVGCDTWDSSYLKSFLNTVLLNRIDSYISTHIVDVTKYSRNAKNHSVTTASIMADSNSLSTYSTNSRIWIPSYSEMMGYFLPQGVRGIDMGLGQKDPNMWNKENANCIDYYTECPDYAAIIDAYLAQAGNPRVLLRTQTALYGKTVNWNIYFTTLGENKEVEGQTVHTYTYSNWADVRVFNSFSSVFIGFCLNA